jgi:hypothetical protein
MNFLYEEKENSPNQHCLASQDANMGTIWSHLNKLCHGCDKKKLALFFIEKEKKKHKPLNPTSQSDYRDPSPRIAA